jgi:hypothetical protein
VGDIGSLRQIIGAVLDEGSHLDVKSKTLHRHHCLAKVPIPADHDGGVVHGLGRARDHVDTDPHVDALLDVLLDPLVAMRALGVPLDEFPKPNLQVGDMVESSQELVLGGLLLGGVISRQRRRVVVRSYKCSSWVDEPTSEGPQIDVAATQILFALMMEVRSVDENGHPLSHFSLASPIAPAMRIKKTGDRNKPDPLREKFLGAALVGDPQGGVYGKYRQLRRICQVDQARILGGADSTQEGSEHPTRRVSMIVPEGELVEVGLKMRVRDAMVDASEPALEQSPEPLDGLGVNVAVDVDPLAVVDPTVGLARLAEMPVGLVFVRVDGRRGENPRPNEGPQRVRATVGDHRRGDAPTSLYRTGYLCLRFGESANVLPRLDLPGARLPTDERLIHLDGARELGVAAIAQHGSDLLEHPPRRLVGDAQLSFELLGRDTASSLGHEEHSVEPQVKRRAGLVEDGPRRWVKVMPAGIAGVRRAGLHSMEAARRPALRALCRRAIRAQVSAPEVVQAGRVVGVVPHEVHEGVGALAGLRPRRVVPMHRAHEVNLP